MKTDKSIYNRIMRDVSRVVKRHINEDFLNNEDFDELFADAATPAVKEEPECDYKAIGRELYRALGNYFVKNKIRFVAVDKNHNKVEVSSLSDFETKIGSLINDTFVKDAGDFLIVINMSESDDFQKDTIKNTADYCELWPCRIGRDALVRQAKDLKRYCRLATLKSGAVLLQILITKDCDIDYKFLIAYAEAVYRDEFMRYKIS